MVQEGSVMDVLGVKPGARILDATAANRCIWETKESRWIVYMDVEPELEVKPDVICDNRHTPYPDGYFHHIVFDPPHGWKDKIGENIYSCRNKADQQTFKNKYGDVKYGFVTSKIPTYYGMDKYKSKTALLGYINKALQEFYRILAIDGVLMMKLKIGDASQTWGSTQTWWVLLMKKGKDHIQTELV